MRSTVFHWVVAFAVCALPLLGCSDEGTMVGQPGTGGNGTGGAGGMIGTGGMGGAGGTGATRTRGVRFTSFESEISRPSLEGVELCEADTDNCALSDELGVARIDVADSGELTFTAEKEGYTPLIWGDVSNEDWALVSIRRMYSHAQMTEVMEEQLGGSYPPTSGVVGLARNPTLQQGGVTFTAIGDTNGEVGSSFYFDGATDEYGTEHNSTGASYTNGHLLPLGEGGFMSVTAGVQTFELGGTGGDCPVSWGWPGDTPNRIRVPVRNGYRTYGSWNCALTP